MNPATFLRALGPEPWNVAYEEPSVRPDDSRYGENPNRIQQHTQFQVVLKPCPANSQELLLGSYAALGIDIDAHDIRFVEDNWESPALGAWGLGYEVWMDGCEITQYTYFQQVGGFPLNPTALEITYGMERILMALQGKNHFKDIEYASGISYGEIFLQNEIEMSRYNLDEADVERNRSLFELYDAEARELIQKRLPIPAYNCLLRTSHIFNVLDARGAVGVTERARYFHRMRSLARDVAALWLERRQELEFPIKINRMVVPADLRESHHVEKPQTTMMAVDVLPKSGAIPATESDYATLLLEIGTEELPPADVDAAIHQLQDNLLNLLQESRLLVNRDQARVQVRATPRRHAIHVHGVARRQPEQRNEIRGPPTRIAFDPKDGSLTQAGIAFAEKNRIHNWDTEVERRQTKQGEYLFVTRSVPGQDALSLLQKQLVESVLAKIQFRRNMRWNDTDVSYSRPIRWLVAMLDDQVIPITYAGVRAAPLTAGLRHSGRTPMLQLARAQAYDIVLESAQIMADLEVRANHILSQARALAQQIQGTVYDPERAILHEVTRLTECPRVLLGSFEATYLALPAPVLITVMQKHQRYFPIQAANGNTSSDTEELRLLNAFIMVANGAACQEDLVRAGNESVLRARFADAKFFYEADRKRSLTSYVAKLDGLIFQERLGSMLDKTKRIELLTPAIVEALARSRRFRITSESLGHDHPSLPLAFRDQAANAFAAMPTSQVDWHHVKEIASQAAALCKADLATQLVVEFTSLAGVMGEHYAREQGYPTEVAQAIFESVLPRTAGDQLPHSVPGAAVALSDRLDSLVGLFGIGLAPKATSDPFGLRRAALALLQILCHGEFDGVELDSLIRLSVAAFGKQSISISSDALTDLLDFIDKRFEQWLLDADAAMPTTNSVSVSNGPITAGMRVDAVRAILRCQRNNPARAYRMLQTLYELLHEERFRNAVTSYLRPARLVRGRSDLDGQVDPALFQDQTEQELWEALEASGVGPGRRPFADDDLASMVSSLSTLRPYVDAFLDHVMVMVDDAALCRNRLNLCFRIAEIPAEMLDLEQLQGWF
jgi:glycyl-tRNA synthetase